MLLVFGRPFPSILLLVGQEHGRTMPLTDTSVARVARTAGPRLPRRLPQRSHFLFAPSLSSVHAFIGLGYRFEWLSTEFRNSF